MIDDLQRDNKRLRSELSSTVTAKAKLENAISVSERRISDEKMTVSRLEVNP